MPPFERPPVDDDQLLAVLADWSVRGEQVLSVSGLAPSTISGMPLSLAELERLASDASTPRGKLLPFAPRHVIADLADAPAPVPETVVAAIGATVRELLFCANVGEYLHGFALYSDRLLFAFMDETGLTQDEFRATFAAMPARPPDDWIRVESVEDVARLADGRVTAVVDYRDGDRPSGAERYIFAFAPDRRLWLIDDIQPR